MLTPRLRWAALFAAIAAASAAPASAQIVTGKIEAKLRLTSTCTINTVVYKQGSTGETTYTALDFGETDTNFSEKDGEMSFQYICSVGSSPKVTLDGGNHYDSSRRMRLSSTTHYVGYRLFSNAGRSAEIVKDGEVPLTGDNISRFINIYGRAYGGTGLSTGDYSDFVTVTLTL